MDKLWSPMQIMWCLTYWTSGDPQGALGAEHFNSSAGTDVLSWMTREGLIDQHGNPTARLEAFVGFICNTPLPVQQWVRP